jgi:uncharacterized protein YtpQ (UPF0354 family)
MNYDFVFELFSKELNQRGYSVRQVTDEGLLIIDVNGTELTVNLDNVSRNYLRDKDSRIITDFVESIINTVQPIPEWEIAKERLYLSAESSDYDYTDIVYRKITETICKVLIYYSEYEGQIAWINESKLNEWGIAVDKAFEIAQRNLDKVMSNTKIEVSDVHGMKLAMFNSIPIFKASLIFAPSFKDFVSPEIGWPIYAVIPARDFVFVFSVNDKGLLNLVGNSVIKEFNESGYPITTEVLSVSDNGISAIGRY